jgi:hypothetical protein
MVLTGGYMMDIFQQGGGITHAIMKYLSKKYAR